MTAKKRPQRLGPRRIAQLGLALLVSLLASEAVVRILGAGDVTLTRGRLHAYDADAGWTCAPDLDVRYAQPESFDVRVVTNDIGLRDRDHTLAKPKGVLRIACLGDSFMWGYGVESEAMLSKVLEDELPGCETINFGANGYSTVQSLIRLETALRYDPDWAVLAFCWNDLEDNFDDKDGGRPALRLGDGTPRIVNRPVRRPWKSPCKQWLRRHSRLFSAGEYWMELLKRRLDDGPSRPRASASERRPPVAPGSETDASASPRAGAAVSGPTALPCAEVTAPTVDESRLRLTRLDVARDTGPEVEHAWSGARWVIQRIRDTMARSGGGLLVVAVTTREEVDAELFERWRASLPEPARRISLDPRSTSARLRRVCEDLDVPFVDLAPAFDAHGAPAELYLHANGHWSAAGHEVAARAVAAKLKSLVDG